MEALNDLRQDIDALDAQLAALYRRRMDVAARIAAVKREQGLPVLQPERERELCARLTELAAPALQPGMQAWFEALRAASRDWQESSPAPGASLRCGLLGEHLRHSYSPEIHAMLGAYSYDLFEVPPEGLADFLHGAAWDGLNVTIPYKRAVVPFCAALSPMAKQTGSVNTLVRRADGTLYGDNADAFGFEYLVRRSGVDVAGKKALVLGNGGASATIQAVLAQLGARVTVISRHGPDNYDNLDRHADARVIVNTTPVGMYPNTGKAAVDLRQFPQCAGVLDIVYNPARTALLLQAESLGIPCAGGLYMLVAQAKRSCEVFTDTVIDDAEILRIHRLLRQEMENIVLIGMPGSGKSTVAARLAEKLDRIALDSDAEIEEKNGMSCAQLIEKHGEAEFRELESEAIAALGKRSGAVIATGGGCVTREENYDLLHQNGIIFWLKRDIDQLPREGRPLSAGDLAAMYDRRKACYERFADHIVDNNGTVEDTVQAILDCLK